MEILPHNSDKENFKADSLDWLHIKDVIIDSLKDDKAEDIVVIDLANKTDIADYMIIATGRVDRHVGAISDHLIEKLREEGLENISAEGMGQCNWVLIDAFNIIIHVFRKEVREFYNLEKMWHSELPKD